MLEGKRSIGKPSPALGLVLVLIPLLALPMLSGEEEPCQWIHLTCAYAQITANLWNQVGQDHHRVLASLDGAPGAH